jgi:hypothetical protein
VKYQVEIAGLRGHIQQLKGGATGGEITRYQRRTKLGERLEELAAWTDFEPEVFLDRLEKKVWGRERPARLPTPTTRVRSDVSPTDFQAALQSRLRELREVERLG